MSDAPRSQTPPPPPSVGAAARAATAAPATGDRPEDHVRGPLSCYVTACPCTGTIGGDGRFFCAWHHGVPVDRWHDITLHLRNRRWLLDAIIELHNMQARPGPGWRKAWPVRARALFADEPDLHPTPMEEQLPNLYLWRLREELAYRVGTITDKPRPRVQQRDEWAQLPVGDDIVATRNRPMPPPQPRLDGIGR